jgi:hypothetical protein
MRNEIPHATFWFLIKTLNNDIITDYPGVNIVVERQQQQQALNSKE